MRVPIVILLSAAMCHAAEPAEGRWEGTIEIPGAPLIAVVDLARSGAEWVGSATFPGFAKGAPLADIAVRADAVSFVVKGVMGEPKFSGKLAPGGTLAGNFVQAGNSAPLHLKRSGPAQVDLPRQSTAVAAGLEGEWQGELTLNGNKLKATLQLSNQPGGRAVAHFVVIGKRRTDIPVDLVRQEGEFLSVISTQFHMTFEGRYRSDSKELTGTFIQGPLETPLIFKRP